MLDSPCELLEFILRYTNVQKEEHDPFPISIMHCNRNRTISIAISAYYGYIRSSSCICSIVILGNPPAIVADQSTDLHTDIYIRTHRRRKCNRDRLPAKWSIAETDSNRDLVGGAVAPNNHCHAPNVLNVTVIVSLRIFIAIPLDCVYIWPTCTVNIDNVEPGYR